MKLETLFDIRVYDGKKIRKEGLLPFIKALEKESSLLRQVHWNEKDILKKLTSGTCLMILMADEVCGLLDYHVQSLESLPIPKQHHTTETAFISDFAILPKYRKLGLGRMLMDVAKNYSRYLGKRYLKLMPEEDQPGLQNFLLHMGFEKRTQSDHEKDIYEFNLSTPTNTIPTTLSQKRLNPLTSYTEGNTVKFDKQNQNDQISVAI